MFIWINRSLGLPFMEQVAVRKVGESDTSGFKLFGLLWWLVSYIHEDDVGESGPFLVTFIHSFNQIFDVKDIRGTLDHVT